MIQPIMPTMHRYKNYNMTFKNSTTSAPSALNALPAGKSDLMLYLESKEKNEKQNQILLSGLSLLLTAGTLAFLYTHNKKSAKVPKGKIEEISGFKSLKNDVEIPTLETCNSINRKLKEFLQNQVDFAKAKPEDIAHAGNPNDAKRLLLYGAPGSGKSFFAKVYAKTLDAEYKEVKYSDLNSVWAGEHLDNIKKCFEDVITTAQKDKNKKYVVVLNEIDSMVLPVERVARGDGGHSAFKVEERSVFLNYLDEVAHEAPNVTIIGTTNVSPKNRGLDGAAMSRFKNIMEVSYPDKKCLNEALNEHLLAMGEGKEFIDANKDKLEDFAARLEKRGCSYRDLNNIANTSKSYYLKDYVNDKNTKFTIEYLEKAQKAIDATDGEIAGAV